MLLGPGRHQPFPPKSCFPTQQTLPVPQVELLGLSGFRTCRVLGKIWWIFLVIPDDAQPLSSSYISANWQHGLSQAQKPMSSALVRGPQHSSAPALRSCTQAEAADVKGATDPTLLGSMLCGTSSPWQGTCLLLTARSLPLSCTDCCYGKLCSQPGSASEELPHTC